MNANVNLMVGSVIKNKNRILISVKMSEKKTIKYCVCKDYAWNHNICACECDKDCEIGKYFKRLHTHEFLLMI